MIHKNGQNFIESKQRNPKRTHMKSKVEILNVEAKQWMKCFDFLDCDVKEGGTHNSSIHFLKGIPESILLAHCDLKLQNPPDIQKWGHPSYGRFI